MNEIHFRELLMDCVIPLPVTTNAVIDENNSKEVPIIKMGISAENSACYHIFYVKLICRFSAIMCMPSNSRFSSNQKITIQQQHLEQEV